MRIINDKTLEASTSDTHRGQCVGFAATMFQPPAAVLKTAASQPKS
jgi:hypothetical protein